MNVSMEKWYAGVEAEMKDRSLIQWRNDEIERIFELLGIGTSVTGDR